MIRFVYRYINFILVSYTIFYFVLLLDLFVLPPKVFSEKVRLFKPYSTSILRASYSPNRSRNRSGIYEPHSVLKYKIFAQSGRVYDFGKLFPEDLLNENATFLAQRTRIFSIQMRVSTDRYLYKIREDYHALFALFPMLFMWLGYDCRRMSLDEGVIYKEVFYYYLFSILIILLYLLY